jgi:hypothetical protein
VGIVRWRVGQCEKHGVELRLNSWAQTPTSS